MTSPIAATTVSGALLRISVCLWGVVANTDTSADLPDFPRPRVEPHRAVLPVETADDAAPVLHGAEAAAEEEQGGRAARGVEQLSD